MKVTTRLYFKTSLLHTSALTRALLRLGNGLAPQSLIKGACRPRYSKHNSESNTRKSVGGTQKNKQKKVPPFAVLGTEQDKVGMQER